MTVMEKDVKTEVPTVSEEELKNYMSLDEMHTRLTQSIHSLLFHD